MKRILLRTICLLLALTLALIPLVSCGDKKEEKLLSGTHYVKMTITDFGDIVLKLDADTAPITVTNFVNLVKDGFYDGLTFIRAQEGFVLQGGCPKFNGSGNSGKTIKGEFAANGVENNIAHEKGVISMARGDDYDSASCQFFICNATNLSVTYSLDGGYAAFGWVIEGMDIIDELTEYMTNECYLGSMGFLPIKDQQPVIERVVVLTDYTES